MQTCPNIPKYLYEACIYFALITAPISGKSKGEFDKNSKCESRSLGGRHYWNMESFCWRRPFKSWDLQTPNFQHWMWQRKKRWFCSKKAYSLNLYPNHPGMKGFFYLNASGSMHLCFTWSPRHSPPVTLLVKCFTSFMMQSEDLCIQ